jgi:hypothetical protein
MPEHRTDHREKAARIADMAAEDPGSALSHLSELPELLVSSDDHVRRHASRAVLNLSVERPLALRSTTEALLARLDDTDADVRTHLLLAVANLAQWYPQDFAAGTELMVASLDASASTERYAAAGAVSQLGYYRPDLVTPREAAHDGLAALSGANFQGEDGYQYADDDRVEEAISALAGGDLASRPLEDDLASVGDATTLSAPARLGVTALLWMPLFFLSYLFLMGRALKVGWRYRHFTPGLRLRIAMGYLSHVTFLLHPKRARLYFRRSWVATPTRLLPFMPGTVPDRADPTVEAPPYPEDWGTLAGLVRQRDDFECRNCGATGGPRGDTELHVDHQQPRSKGGLDHPENLRTLCRACHEARHARKFD